MISSPPSPSFDRPRSTFLCFPHRIKVAMLPSWHSLLLREHLKCKITQGGRCRCQELLLAFLSASADPESFPRRYRPPAGSLLSRREVGPRGSVIFRLRSSVKESAVAAKAPSLRSPLRRCLPQMQRVLGTFQKRFPLSVAAPGSRCS